jgi:antitoxin (DNA-binding transcriptional repressor) of toxin-antitoxin stability system
MSTTSVHGNLSQLANDLGRRVKQRCLRVLDEVGEAGEPIVIAKRGKAVAQLTAVGRDRHDDWRRAMAGRGEILGDFGSEDRADRWLVATALEHALVPVIADRATREFAPLDTLW